MQIPGDGGFTVTEGLGFTVTTTVCCALLQPPAVPVTLYVIVLTGLATTLAPVVALKAVFGVHV